MNGTALIKKTTKIMYGDAGVSGTAQYMSQLIWILSFREKQIKKLMAEEPLEDIEDSSEDFTLSDISMEDFHTDLMSYTKSQNDKLEQLPLGLNAIMAQQHYL